MNTIASCIENVEMQLLENEKVDYMSFCSEILKWAIDIYCLSEMNVVLAGLEYSKV